MSGSNGPFITFLNVYLKSAPSFGPPIAPGRSTAGTMHFYGQIYPF